MLSDFHAAGHADLDPEYRTYALLNIVVKLLLRCVCACAFACACVCACVCVFVCVHELACLLVFLHQLTICNFQGIKLCSTTGGCL